MLKVRTVFVLGAGASAPYGFPTGAGLRRSLLAALTKDHRGDPTSSHYINLRALGFKDARIDEFGRELEDSGKASVDAFLEHRPEYLDVGKAAMASILLPYEHHTLLFGPNAPQEGHWYEYAFNKFATKFEELERNDVTFLTFNYDRSLEYYLITAVQSAYKKSFDDAAKKVAKFGMLHLYGDLGELTESDASRWRKPDIDADRIRHAADRIQIMHTDGADRNFSVARKFLSEAEVICFLGFGFHPTNVQRLLDSVKPRPGAFATFTTFKLLNAEITAVVTMLQPVFASLGRGEPGSDVLHFLREKFVWW